MYIMLESKKYNYMDSQAGRPKGNFNVSRLDGALIRNKPKEFAERRNPLLVWIIQDSVHEV